MRKLFVLIPLLVLAALAQNPSPIQSTGTAPSGNCGSTNVRLLVPNGTIYTCQNGTWAPVSGGGGGGGTVTNIATTLPIQGGPITTTGTISCRTATGAVSGCLSAADFTTFNSKQAAGSYITALTGDVTASGPGSAAATIANDAVTTVKILNANVTAAKMVNAGVFTGDVTTTFPAVTVAKVNGIAYSATGAAHSVPVITTANTTATYKAVPDCTDTGGNHLNFTQSTDAFSCGTSGGSSGVTSIATTSPITGGTITTTGTIACATCVVASSPGVGLAHFAGSTQTVTSSAVNLAGADVTGLLGNGNYYGTLGKSYVTTSEATTSPSTTYAQLATADTVTFTLAATTTVVATFTAQCSSSVVTTGIFVQFTVDGSDVAATSQEFDATNIGFLYACTASYGASLASGAHTILTKYKASGTSVQTFAHRLLMVYASP